MSTKLHPWSMGRSNRSPFRRVGERRAEPDPEPAEIAALCEEIQRGWSPLERQARKSWVVIDGQLIRPNLRDLPPEYEIPEVRYA